MKKQNIKNRGLSNDMYKEKILQFIETYEQVTRKEIEDLLFEQMPNVLTDEQKERRIKYLLIECLSKKEDKVKSIKSGSKSVWIINT